ncbi:MAG: zinc-dependent metalloprotease [Bdellovibrionales bacterium]|nr:zinc-dependent metalloprotease [Bdellovibrionales bacterium]
MKQLKLVIAILLGLTLTTACTKKRAKVEGQFNDPNVIGKSIDLYKDRSFTLTTGKVKYDVSRSSAENYHNETKNENFIDLPVVEYNVEYPKGMPNLLGDDVRLRGIPNGHKYEIRTYIVNDQLWVGKVGTIEEIPTDEITIADKLSDGRYLVPLVTYNVSYFQQVLVKNADNEDTNQIAYKALKTEDRAAATHISIDETSGELAKPLLKTDVFKSDYFQGDWFFAMTVVQAQNSSGRKLDQGISTTGTDSNLQSATRVKFLRTESSLQVVNVNVDERLLKAAKDQSSELEFDQVMSIPAELIDYRKKVNNKGIPQAEEEEYSERKLQERDWIKLDLESAFTLDDLFSASVASLFKGSRKLTDLRIADDFWSFTILAKDNGAKIRYSFYKVDSALSKNYKARNYIVKDRDYFGLFNTRKAYIPNYEQYTQEDLEKYLFIKRFNPDKKEIVFHMSHGMAQSNLAIELAEEALGYWDKAFDLAGTGISVRLDKSKTVDLGDLRYNVLNIIDRVASGDMNGGGLLFGVGPSISDPKTGEIVSVSNTLHIDSFRAVAVSQIRNYILNEAGLLERIKEEVGQNFSVSVSTAKTSQMLNPSDIFATLMVNPKTMDQSKSVDLVPVELPVKSSVVKNGFQSLPMAFNADEMLDARTKYFLEKKSGRSIKSAQQFIDAYKKYGRDLVQSGEITSQRSEADGLLDQYNRNSFHKIAERCPEITDFAKNLKGSIGPSDESNPIVIACANKLIKDLAMATLTHELGHNFGLSHNFASSNDKDNFWTAEEVKDNFGLDLKERGLNEDALKTASIMEYMPSTHDENIVPGKYDIAALRYAYTGSVVSKSSGLPKRIPDLKKSLEENFGREMTDVQTYRYCDDFDAFIGHDPLCIRHDFGTTPAEIATNFIADYYDSLINRSYRLDRKGLSSGVEQGFRRFDSIFVPLKRLYDEWRFHLSDFMADGNLYLSQVDESKYQSILADMEKSKQYGPIYKTWKPTRDIVMQFLADVTTLPNHYCIGLTADNKILPVELDELIDRIKRYDASEVVRSCDDQVVRETFKKDYGAEYIVELGFSPEDRHFSLRAKDELEPLDYAGVSIDRVMANATMGLRQPLSFAHLNRNFFPNMFDEPDYRNYMGQTLVTRAMAGVDLAQPIMNRLGQLISERSQNADLGPEFAQANDAQKIDFMMNSNILSSSEKSIIKALISELQAQAKNLQASGADPATTGIQLRFPRFKRETEIALSQYLAFVGAQGVPGEQYESRVRLAPFMARETGDPQYVQQQGIVASQLPNGSYITAFPSSNPIAATLIQTFEGVNGSLSLASFTQEDFAAAKKYVDSLVTHLPTDENGNFTVQAIIDIIDQPEYGLKTTLQNQSVPREVKMILQMLFGFEIQVYQQNLAKDLATLKDKIAKGTVEESEKAQGSYDKLVATDLKPFYQKSQQVIASQKRVTEELENVSSVSAEVHANKDEYEAQRDLLLQILTN